MAHDEIDCHLISGFSGSRLDGVVQSGKSAWGNRLLVMELMRCAYLDHRESIILIGNPGTGKTHIATALAVEACGRGKRVRFWKVTELITHLIEAREERQLARMKRQLAKLDLLVLDELGYVPTSKLGAELLFDVVSTAYERTSLIVTTNLPFENWTEVLGSERLTGAAQRSLLSHCCSHWKVATFPILIEGNAAPADHSLLRNRLSLAAFPSIKLPNLLFPGPLHALHRREQAPGHSSTMTRQFPQPGRHE